MRVGSMPSAQGILERVGETESAVRMVGMTEPTRMRGNPAYRWGYPADPSPLRSSYD
jgi:hypothetical protein